MKRFLFPIAINSPKALRRLGRSAFFQARKYRPAEKSRSFFAARCPRRPILSSCERHSRPSLSPHQSAPNGSEPLPDNAAKARGERSGTGVSEFSRFFPIKDRSEERRV